ncbi:hypothetical protein [Actinobaculum sp. 352]|uniref:hypothetical protein n=1 Tax=Actinobaculum sp. 352 TaxID=2490946 RepID=UPI000F7F0A14|nr:hypothetical protein [Actinobaculum sp. 352]RTE49551.1 hypothetical protein EKN07_05735 [Actinobaculum sp. 352]
MKKNRLMAGVASLLLASAPVVVPQAATAAPFDLAHSNALVSSSDRIEDELVSFFDRYGVPKTQQQGLIDKLNNGVAWDSMSGASPVTTETSRVGASDVTIERYADGSVVVSTIDAVPENPDDPMPAGISSCRLVSSSNYHANYKNCFANVEFGVWQMGFHFDRNTVKGRVGSITRYYGMTHRLIGGSLSNHRFTKFSSSRVRYSANLSVLFKGFPAGWTAWMEVRLGTGGAAWTVHNFKS